jgi:low affinity Fe/Cu permease
MATNNNGSVNEYFRKFSQKTSEIMGSPWAFIAAIIVILLWALSGPVFHYSDTWQLVINTSTTIITFLMVFLIQNTQNRDAKAIHLKLDELIHGNKNARNKIMGLEEMNDEELEKMTNDIHHLKESRSQRKQKK